MHSTTIQNDIHQLSNQPISSIYSAPTAKWFTLFAPLSLPLTRPLLPLYKAISWQNQPTLPTNRGNVLEMLFLLMPSCQYQLFGHLPTPALPRYFTLQSATYLQNCTYHKVLLSAANKSVLIVVSKEIEPPLNELSIGCLGLQYYWILAAYCNSRWKRRSLFGFLLPRSTAGQWAQKSPPSNHDVENLRRIEFIHENWHSTSLYHPLTGQREAGRFPNIP